MNESIEDRILLNIACFEEEIKLADHELSDNTKLSSSKAIKKLWLMKYHPDKYHKPLTDKAKNYLNRTLLLINLWTDFEKKIANRQLLEVLAATPIIRSPLAITN